jgi:23S rRNA (uracil1939-C5)-methyltransferase
MGETMRLEVERMAYGPDAIAHADDGRVVMVAGAVLGDVVEVEVQQDKGRFLRARTTRVLEPSPMRVTPACPYATLCGGCPWAALSREAQLEVKRSVVADALVRIGGLDADEAASLVRPTVRPMPDWGYRNKIELAAARQGGRLAIGMHGLDGSILKVRECPLLSCDQRGIVKAVTGALGYLLGSRDIDLERVAIRSSRRTHDVEVALWTPPSAFPRGQAARVLGEAARISSLVRVIEKGPAKARRVVRVERLSGAGSWSERVRDHEMRFSAPSFFQVNTAGAETLVTLVLDGLEPKEDDVCWDLYSGAGTFTLPLAESAGWVEAVESAGSSVRDLRRNLEAAGITNVGVTGGDVALEPPDERPDLVVVDPPRAGLAPEVVDALCACGARRIAYVSCDPATLARDLARFRENDVYSVRSVQPVDQFAQTFHVETVVMMSRELM